MAQSPIERKFAEACRRAGLAVEAEQMVGRYRPDFLMRPHRLIIELDGHDTHASVEARTSDAVRQRYLQRLGWTVIRFTGREVTRDASACVAEVADHILALETPAADFAVYIDWLFFQRAVVDFNRRNGANLEAGERITRDTFLKVLSQIVAMPKSVAVHLFGTASTFSTSMADLETSRILTDGDRRFIIEEHQSDFLAIALLDHLKAHRPIYGSNVVLVADDGAYPPEFLDADPQLVALIRKDESRSRMLTIRAAKWQDIDYLFAPLAGVALHDVM